MKIKRRVAFSLLLTALSGGGRLAWAQSTPQADAASVDHLIHAAWQQKGIFPAKPAEDARCLTTLRQPANRWNRSSGSGVGGITY